MNTQHDSKVSSDKKSIANRSLLLIWQNPATRTFHKVGQLDVLNGDKYVFSYLPEAHNLDGFTPLVEFPEMDVPTTTETLPFFFSNRVMTTKRPGYAEYLNWLGLSDVNPELVPFESLIRTGGGRTTDTFHVVEKPDDGREFVSRFFVSGVRYLDDSASVIGSLKDGASLELQQEPDNVKNPYAVRVQTSLGQKVGYVPDWLCADITHMMDGDAQVRAVAEQVNKDAPFHLQVLCRIEIERA